MELSEPERERVLQQLAEAHEYLAVALKTSARKAEHRSVTRLFIPQLSKLLGAFGTDFAQLMVDDPFWRHLMELQAIVDKSVPAAETPDADIELTWGSITDEGDFALRALERAIGALGGDLPPSTESPARMTRSMVVVRIREEGTA